jgi:PAS domain S-box-containing protein
LLAAAPDALIAVQPNGTIMFANDEAGRLFGWPRADLVGLPIECLMPDSLAFGHAKLVTEYMTEPAPRPMGTGLELVAQRRDGTQFPVEISLNDFTTPVGVLVAAAIRDATMARRSEQHFRAMLAAAPDATIGVSTSGRIELVNAQTQRLFGWSAAELIGQQIEVLIPGAVRTRHIQHRAGYVRDAQPRPMGAGLQLSGMCKDGSTFPAEVSLSTVTDEDGDLLVLAAVRDVRNRIELDAERQRVALEAQREQSHRLESLGELAGGIAHDFNNLLGVILNYVTLISRRIDDSTAVADLGEIRGAAERGAALTAQLLTFARRDVVNREPLDLTAVVRSVASMLERTLGEHIELRLELTDAPIVVACDRSQLEQILMNLAINARDAMPDGGVLTIAAKSDGGPDHKHSPALLSVTDTGHGMTPEVAARAFEPFFTTKARGRGTGLGLATVYGIVLQNDGDIVIESVVEEGTTVVVHLPRAAEPGRSGHSHAEIAAGTPAVSGGHERILLVEDEAALRVGTARLLIDAGYSVVTAADGVEALDIFDENPDAIDLVVTDVAMPLMRGDELALELSGRVPELQVIFMTGYDSGEVPLPGRVLAKPVIETRLLEAVREVLDD